MIEIPEAVIRQALHPFSTLPVDPSNQRVVGRYTSILLHKLPMPEIVEPRPSLTIADVDAAVEESRAVVREYEKSSTVWLTGPDHPWLADALAQRGLRNEDSAGMESVETAMALLQDPCAQVKGIVVSLVDSFEALQAGYRVELASFGSMADEWAAVEARMNELWQNYNSPDSNKRWNASLDGRVVGTARGAFGDGGVNLFGGAVLPDARGHGVYRALVQARWDAASALKVPALTVQAGRMSRPVLEGLGFTPIAEMPTYVDHF